MMVHVIKEIVHDDSISNLFERGRYLADHSNNDTSIFVEAANRKYSDVKSIFMGNKPSDDEYIQVVYQSSGYPKSIFLDY